MTEENEERRLDFGRDCYLPQLVSNSSCQIPIMFSLSASILSIVLE